MHASQPGDQPPTADSSDAARKKRRTRLILVFAGGTALCLCALLCAAAAVWLMGTGGVRLAQERDSIAAVLEAEDGQWRLHTINVTVPPAKVLTP